MNWNSIHFCLPIKIKKQNKKVANDLAVNMTIVNDFFVHWIKQIDIKCYGDGVQILSTNNPTEIYRYSDAILKHMPKDALKTYEKTLLYSKGKVILTGNRDRKLNSANDADDPADANLSQRITKFANVIKQNNTYRIPLFAL